MAAELIFKLDDNLVKRVKEYAAKNKISLSGVLEKSLALLLAEKKKGSKDIEIPPFVKSISTGLKPSENIEIKAEYYAHLMEKHK